MLFIQLTMTTSWLPLLPPLFPCCLSLQCCRKGQQDQVLVQVSPMIVGMVRQGWAVFDLRVHHQYQPLHELLSQRCCWMLPKSWDLAHWHYWKWCCCYWLKSLRPCQLCCCWWPFQGGKRKEGSWLGPEAGAHYCPDDGWGAGAVAACQSSPPAVGGGSSCGRCGTWFCKTSWSKKKEEKRQDKKYSNKAKWKPAVTHSGNFLLTCRTACRGKSWPVGAQEPPLPEQKACSLADRWVLSAKKRNIC